MSASRELVEALCSDACAGRRAGTPGGLEGRRLVARALRAAGLDPHEQPLPGHGGGNVLASVAGDVDRWVVVAAHHDHLGTSGTSVFRGADDNAAAVAILVEVARALAAAPPAGRGVLVAAFDAEEPPFFLGPQMGSEHWTRHPTIPLERVDLMVCMDLVGHALGGEGFPSEVRDTVFALGAERSLGTGELVDALGEAEPGVIVRRVDGEIIEPLSDYAAFWQREIPWLLLTSGRSRVYHTPEDTPDLLDWPKIDATARWLERFVRASCERPESRLRFRQRRDDASTLRAIVAVTGALAPFSPEAQVGRQMARSLLASCDASGELRGHHERMAMLGLVARLETALG